MKNMKIAMKLIVSFGLVITLLVISMGVSIFNLTKLSEKVDYYSGQAIPMINAMWTGRRAMVATERALYHAATTNDAVATKKYIDEAETQIAAIKDVLAIMESSYTGDQADVQKYRALMDSTAEVKQQVYDMLLVNDNVNGLNLMAEKYTPTFVEAGNLLTDMANDVQARVNTYTEEAQRNSSNALFLLGGLALASILGAVVVCGAIVRSLTKPIREIEHAAVQMSEGHLDVEIAYQSKDELGNLADRIRVLTGTLRTIINDEAHLLSEMSKGNFAIRTACEDRYVGGFREVILSVREINRSLSSTLSQINEAANQVSSGSEQVSSGAQALSQGATEQASSIQELATTIGDISTQVNENAERAQHASTLADTAGQEMQQSADQMREMMAAMTDISDSSNEIGKIIKTIEDIAFQTNILALNAAVEAARAGAAGKGFAVVADEVRSLANKSQEASKNTAVLIENSLKAVQNGLSIAEKASRSMISTMESAKEVTQIVTGISGASVVQARSIEQVTQGVDQISGVVQTNSATAEQSAAASEELSGQAQMLRNLVGRFRLQDTECGGAAPAMAARIETATEFMVSGDKY